VPLDGAGGYIVGKEELRHVIAFFEGHRLTCVCTEREVKKANREIQSLLNNMDGAHSQLQLLQKKYNELLSDMKRMEREHSKAKKRGDQLQKEKDAQRSELTKVTTMKDKLDKLSRDFAKENKKLKDELHKLENSESTARHELHTRLETLIAEVDDCIRVAEGPERQDERDIELDEVCVASIHTTEEMLIFPASA
jgi:chromosome segregation ATPase